MRNFSEQRIPTLAFTQPETYRLSRLPVDQASTLILYWKYDYVILYIDVFETWF